MELRRGAVFKMKTPNERRYLRYFILALCTISIFTVFYTPPYILRPREVAGWELNVTRQTKVYIAPNNDTSLISGREICSDRNLDLIIVVCSSPANSALRHAIRQTWASVNISTVKVAFLLGIPQNTSVQTTIEEEHEEFRDVIQENFIDTYNNLTVKSVMMLKWFLNRCPSPKYLMKTDDDMYINVTLLLSVLSTTKPTSLLLGSLICRAKPIQNYSSKWYSPTYIYNKPFYPNYLSGTAYLMSRDVAGKLYDAALSTRLMHLEDVFLTGICAAAANIKPRNHPTFNYQHIGAKCDPRYLTNHRMNVQSLHTLWSQRHNCTVSPAHHSNSTLKTNFSVPFDCLKSAH